jgi:hypothetical protein
MKKADREIYMVLANEIDSLICDFCSYDLVDCCGESPCDCGESSCHHPLKDRLEMEHSSYGIEPGEDCWGFRPCYSVELCADVVGIVLANHWRYGYRLWKNKNNVWKIASIKSY